MSENTWIPTRRTLPEPNQLVLWYKDGRYMDKKYLLGWLVEEDGQKFVRVNHKYKEKLNGYYYWKKFDLFEER